MMMVYNTVNKIESYTYDGQNNKLYMFSSTMKK